MDFTFCVVFSPSWHWNLRASWKSDNFPRQPSLLCLCSHISWSGKKEREKERKRERKREKKERKKRKGRKKGKEKEVAWSCLTLCDPTDCSLPGSSVHGIFQARVLEWVAISFSRGSSRPRDWTCVSCIVGRHFTVWAKLVCTWG